MVTISSLTALPAPPRLAACSGAKNATDQVVLVVAVEYGARRIRVNTIAPDLTCTAMTAGHSANSTLEPAFPGEIPLCRTTTVGDIANASLWLLSDEAFVAGPVIDRTGGKSLRRTLRSDEVA